jgi:acyl carrier protein
LEVTEIAGKVTGFIEESFVYDQDTELVPDDSLLDTGLIDSTGVLELVAFLEETFAISVEDEELVPANLDSITRIAAFVGRKLGK